MSREKLDMYKCDRCGAVALPLGDDLPSRWAHVTFNDAHVRWERDLCVKCGDDVGQVIRREAPKHG